MVNTPLPGELGKECAKAAKIIEKFVKPGRSSGPDQLIPPDIIANAKGVAILSVIKAGFLFSGRAGSGIVVARLPNGGWSAPSGIMTAGMGVGGQIGAELTDFVIILNTVDAVKAFSHGGNVTLGGNLSVAAGPIGRSAEASGTIGNFAAVYSYSKTKGLFAGISIEGSAIIERKDCNAEFYGRKVSAKELLSGSVPAPAAADALYDALDKRSRTTKGDTRLNEESENQSQSTNDQRGSFAPTSSHDISNERDSHNPNRNNQSAYINNATNSHTSQSRPSSGFSYKPPVALPTNKATENPFSSSTAAAPLKAAPPIPARIGNNTAVALFDFGGEQNGDLSFKKGDLIIIKKETENQNDWWTGTCHGRDGIFPANYVQRN